MTLYFIRTSTANIYNLVGVEDEGQFTDIKTILSDITSKVYSFSELKNVEVFDIQSQVYAELYFEFIEGTLSSFKVLDIDNLGSLEDNERQLLLEYVGFSESGISEFNAPIGANVTSSAGNVKIQHLPDHQHIYNELTGQPEQISETVNTVKNVSASNLFESEEQEYSNSSALTGVFTPKGTDADSIMNVGAESADFAGVPTLYYCNDEGLKCIFAVRYTACSAVTHQEQEQFISVEDIVRNQATADFVASLADGLDYLSGVFDTDGGMLKCRLLATASFFDSPKVMCRDIETELSSVDEGIYQHLSEAYDKIAGGFDVLAALSDIILPQVSKCSLSFIKFFRSTPEAKELYTSMYASVNPTTSNACQTMPTSKLSLAIPTYQAIKCVYSNNDTTEQEMEASADSDDDYQNNLLQTYDSLNIGINTEYIPILRDYAGSFDFHDCLFYKEAAMVVKPNEKEHYIALIEGNAENNDNPISDAELEVYLALRNLVVYDLCTEKKLYTLAEINKALALGMRGKIMSDFLNDMLYNAYVLNWSHTGDVFDPTEASEGIASDDEDVSTRLYSCYYHVRAEQTADNKVKFVKTVNESEIQMDNFLEQYQSRQSGLDLLKRQIDTNVINSFGHIDAIIRLLRWGDMKPSFIYVPSYLSEGGLLKENAQKEYVNLADRVVSGFSGIWKSTDRVEFDDGAYYLVDGQITLTAEHGYSSSTFSDSVDSGSSLLCGVTLLSYYGSTESSQNDFIDVFTLATGIANGAIKVCGIKYDPDTKKFSTSPSDLSAIGAYDPEARFLSGVDAFDVRESPSGVYQEYRTVVYKSSYLVKLYRTIGHLIPRLDNKAYPNIFEILTYASGADLSNDILSRCSKAVIDSSATGDTIKSLLRELALNEKGFIESAFAQSVTNRFIAFNKAFSRTSGTLADALTTALETEIQFSQNGTSTTATTDIRLSARDYIEKGLEACAKITTLDGVTTIGFLGQSGNHLVVWKSTDYDIQPQVTSTLNLYSFGKKMNSIPAGSDSVWSIIVGTFSSSSKESRASFRDKFNRLTKSFFVESVPNTLESIIIALMTDASKRQGKT